MHTWTHAHPHPQMHTHAEAGTYACTHSHIHNTQQNLGILNLISLTSVNTLSKAVNNI